MPLSVEGNIGSTVVRLPGGMSRVQLEAEVNRRIGRAAVTPLPDPDCCLVSVRLDRMGTRTTLDVSKLLGTLGCQEI